MTDDATSESSSAYSNLIFSTASVPISKTLGEIRKTSLSIHNRFKSIDEDSQWIERVATHLKLPVIANERCGSWYVPPDLKAGSAYFKSTDGHYGQWRFNLRRLNLHILPIIARGGGAILVDSTRQGKHLPDAFSRTVPIWCAVINRLLFPDSKVSQFLVTPEEIVSASEQKQIKSRLNGYVDVLRELKLDVVALRDELKKPIIPQWRSRSFVFSSNERPDDDDEFWTLHCVMASRYQASGVEIEHDEYVQGSGDDAEFWGHGITPKVYWRNRNRFLDAAEADLPGMIRHLLADDEVARSSVNTTVVNAAPWLRICSIKDLEAVSWTDTTCAIVCAQSVSEDLKKSLKDRVLLLQCSEGKGKSGSRDLRTQLEKLPSFIAGHKGSRDIVIACATGRDLSVGVALVLLCQHCSPDGELLQTASDKSVDKTMIRQRLAWITSSMPEVNPSRATLNAVNSFLMKPP